MSLSMASRLEKLPRSLAILCRSRFRTLRIRRSKTGLSLLGSQRPQIAGCLHTERGAIFALLALGGPRRENEEHMKKAVRKSQTDIRAEYDFSGAVRGKYARRYAQGTNVVALAPDVARVFPDAESVNSSLRALAEIIRRQRKPPNRT
jgi:hypothetical protein